MPEFMVPRIASPAPCMPLIVLVSVPRLLVPIPVPVTVPAPVAPVAPVPVPPEGREKFGVLGRIGDDGSVV